MPDIHGWPRGRRTALSLALLGLLLLSSGAVPGGTAADDTAELLHVADWRDGGHQGADLTVDISADGSRLLLVGYAAPDDVRVTDRDLVPVAVLEPGPGPFDVKGAAWSATDGSALVWGRAAGGDRDVILAYEAPTYALNGSYGASDYGGLVQVDAVCTFAMGLILAVAGRDANGTSMVNVLETASMAVMRQPQRQTASRLDCPSPRPLPQPFRCSFHLPGRLGLLTGAATLRRPGRR